MSFSSGITTSTWCMAVDLNFVKNTDVPLRGNFGGHSEHILKFSALYYCFPFQNLKFLDCIIFVFAWFTFVVGYTTHHSQGSLPTSWASLTRIGSSATVVNEFRSHNQGEGQTNILDNIL